MLIYNYDENTKEFKGESEAFLDPLATEQEGKPVYLMPANATKDKPIFEDGKVAVWTGVLWKNVVDNRGKKYYDFDVKQIKEITTLGNEFIPLTEEEINGIYQGKQVEMKDGKYHIYFSIEELKKIKNEEINTEREKAQQTDSVPFDEDLFDIDETTQRNILGLLQFAQSNPDITTFIFRSRSNINHQLTAKQLADLGVAITLKIQEIYQRSWKLKSKVDEATTEEEINNIKWEE